MELVNLLETNEPLDFEALLPMPEAIKNGADYNAPGISDGLPGWHQWAREHWGVKWNAQYSDRRGYGRTGRVRYRFQTAYGPPMKFLSSLALRFPTVEVDLTFDTEGDGEGELAHMTWRDGKFLDAEKWPEY